jgi:hypothetical protein
LLRNFTVLSPDSADDARGQVEAATQRQDRPAHRLDLLHRIVAPIRNVDVPAPVYRDAIGSVVWLGLFIFTFYIR